jgi:hypothetical protein
MADKCGIRKWISSMLGIHSSNSRKSLLFFIILLISNFPIFSGGKKANKNISVLNPDTRESQIEIIEEKITQNTVGRKYSDPLFLGDGGKGMVIAVPAPIIRNGTTADKWMPQFIQDLVTGDLARFSAMTVIDRANEQLAIAEQQLSESGFYSNEDFITIGSMTNAQYLVVGNIQNMSGNYTMTFRINDIAKNEIRTAFNRQYSLRDIESGKAVKEIAWELLTGIGIELTPAGERLLFDQQEAKIAVQATRNLAHGMVAEKSNNIVDALAFFSGALDSDNTKAESDRHIQSFFIDIPTDNIRERANYALVQKGKWEKIFSDLKIYIRENLPVFIYDFSIIEDKFDTRSKEVALYVGPGIKVIPNRTVLFVYKTILDNWFRIRKIDENKEWVKDVRLPGGTLSTQPNDYNLSYTYSADIGLFDDYGDRIASFHWYGASPRLYCDYLMDNGFRVNESFQVYAQHKYYAERRFEKIMFKVPLDKITENITPRIERFYLTYIADRGNRMEEQVSYSPLTIMEWQEWIVLQEGIR